MDVFRKSRPCVTHKVMASLNEFDDSRSFVEAMAFSTDTGGRPVEECVALADVVLSAPPSSRAISWNQQVQLVGTNGSLSSIPLAMHDGFHNCRQYDTDPFDIVNLDESLNLFGEGAGNWVGGHAHDNYDYGNPQGYGANVATNRTLLACLSSYFEHDDDGDEQDADLQSGGVDDDIDRPDDPISHSHEVGALANANSHQDVENDLLKAAK